MKPYQLILSGALASGALLAPAALAQVVSIPEPSPLPASEFVVKTRWGGSGYEVAIRDNSADTWQLNPTGNPAWGGVNLNQNIPFRIEYARVTGNLEVRFDFNRDGDFLDTAEFLQNSTFTAGGNGLGLVSYQNYGFNYVSIWSNDTIVGTNPQNSEINSLNINGTSLGNPTIGANVRTWYQNANASVMENIVITGNVKFFGASGFSGENPVFNFEFRGAAIPEPSTYAMMAGFGLAGFAAVRRWRSKVS